MASIEQIKEWFEMQSCVQIGLHKWEFPNGTVVSDALPRNIILQDGHLFPIDLHVEKFRCTDSDTIMSLI
jgi:hypothetical protein